MNRIMELRKARNLTQDELGQILNVGKGAVSRYEQGKRQLTPETIHTLCDLFGCTADYLLGRSDRQLPAVAPEDARLLAAYHALPLEIRRAVDGLMAPYMEIADKKQVS